MNTSKFNWISGFIGHRGIAISCIANFSSARVELYIGKPDKEKNKKTYDYLKKIKLKLKIK